ncbi:phosphotransferase family protein [Sphingosinicella soli]|uniref:Aminoglycoside phosphotransferase (APT) family kinase protein n=1 Tax=Sphingosinicella soli TaxID=333708 RepID=A0A7W7B072_9SPHN|nr:phosphotransferase family protein [Sphingosinicella soli]MBB4631631.1 aminoglycoside phosphotransferase (APT) family kinase protein [Sphingosinicella soli]
MAGLSDSDSRAEPDEAFIARIRAAYPVEAEIDRVLTRKLRGRGGPEYAPVSLDELVDGVAALIRADIGDRFSIRNPRWLAGGASKLQMAFDLDWAGKSGEGPFRTEPMVLRMEPPEAIVETSRLREFEILGVAGDVVPVPPCYWVDAEGGCLPHPALIYGFAAGTTKPAARPSTQVTGIGTNFGPELRQILAEQFVDHLAAIHTIDPARLATLQSFEQAEVGSNASVLRQIAWWRRVWDEDRPEELPLVDVAARWLIANAPPLDHVSLVHGDFRAGNFLFDEESRRITAWLDWELAVLGDRHQDLTWTTGVHFGHYHEDGQTFLASGLLPVEELHRRYKAAAGLSIDPVRLRYYRIFNDFTSCVHMLATAARVARGGKTHQDVVVGWLSMIGNVIAGKLRDSLAEVLR